jgi:putative Mn2+ efflux pump MntP
MKIYKIIDIGTLIGAIVGIILGLSDFKFLGIDFKLLGGIIVIISGVVWSIYASIKSMRTMRDYTFKSRK